MSPRNPDTGSRQRERAYAQHRPPPTDDGPASLDPSELARRYSHIVHVWARRYAGTSAAVIDWHDLVSVGMMGLIQAAQRFDPSSGKPFETYAEFRVKGAMLDELRRVDPFSQPQRRKVRRLSRAMEELRNELGREPTEDELAQFLALPIEQIRELLTQLKQSHQEGVEDIDRHALSRELAVSGWSRADLHIALTSAISKLDKRNQTILALYYFEGLAMAEIAQLLKVTEARISQLHSAAIKELRVAVSDGPRG
ncbi:MAG: FliA/WhiG family RNA polymerase sigma factor [Deltaproteobacteria bacterium]|nr:FliA/WhiG family RNA polymerase sigma factor [Deltaproteobacteria bacterium]